jgi:hypothetical protein
MKLQLRAFAVETLIERFGGPPMRVVHVEALGVLSMPDAPRLVAPMPDVEVTVTYPSASPDVYLRWLAYFREVEAAMLGHPALADLAMREAGPFVQGETAGFISTAVGQLAAQAREARAMGLTRVAPTITGAARLLAQSLLLAERRNAWLEADLDGRPLVEVLGIDSLDEDGHRLRAAALDAVRGQLLALL